MSSNIDYPYMDDIIVVFVTNILFFATIIVYLTTYTKKHVKPPREHYFLKWSIICWIDLSMGFIYYNSWFLNHVIIDYGCFCICRTMDKD
jgi:hypothetical protein